jgi:diguanylate cyclase (GGDEF)-like protein/PAS domain S-box-containing protein
VQSEDSNKVGSELRGVLERICDVLLQLDATGRIGYASPGWERVLGFQPTQMRQLVRMIHADDRERVEALIGDSLEHGRTGKLEYRLHGKDDERLWFELQAVPVGAAAGSRPEAVYLLHRDTTSRHRYEERLLSLAYHDPLTGLPNRRLFREYLNQALAMSKRSGLLFGILYIDINDFKRINDSMGHGVGDRFLQAFAARMRGSLREVDILARMGGDEFAALLPGILAPDSLRAAAARIRQTLSAVWHIGGCKFKASASIGAAVYPNDGEDAVQLLRRADLNLYEAKHEYRGEELSS